jgi:UMF1 family MFS transporter
LAFISPLLGALADYEKMKKKFFSFFLLIAVTSAVAFIFAPNWITFLIFFIISRLGYSACNIFYDAMLVDVTTNERMDKISTFGYAFGYIGSCIPFILGILLIIIAPISHGATMADRTIEMQLSFLLTVIWWIGMSIPLLKNVKQNYFLEARPDFVKHSFKRLGLTFILLKKDKKLLYFILGYFFYIDGVYTIISMATTYGREVGIDSIQMILALLLTQFVAFPCAILSGKLAYKFGTTKMIKIFIIMYACICVFGYGLDTTWEFWVLAVAVGMCQGGIQALSRSQFGKLVPKEESSEYFGFFDIFGKFADFFGPLILAACAFFLGSSKYGVLALVVLFIIGFILLSKSEKLYNQEHNAKL